MARPTKYTPQVAQKVEEALRTGNTRKASCSYAGISQSSFALWLARYSDFRDTVEKAEAAAEMSHVANIAQQAKAGEWTASAWWLERRRPDDWGRVDRVEVVVRQQAARLAEELGVSATAVLEEAERLAREAMSRA